MAHMLFSYPLRCFCAHKRLYSNWWTKWKSQSQGSPVNISCSASRKLTPAETSLKYLSRFGCVILQTDFFSKAGIFFTGSSCRDVVVTSHCSSNPRVDQRTRSQNFVMDTWSTYASLTWICASTSFRFSSASAIRSISSFPPHCFCKAMAVARATVSAHRMVMLTQRGPPTFSMLQGKTAARTVRTDATSCDFCLDGVYLCIFMYIYIYTEVLYEHISIEI